MILEWVKENKKLMKWSFMPIHMNVRNVSMYGMHWEIFTFQMMEV